MTATEQNILAECLYDEKFEFGHSCEVNSHFYRSTRSPLTKSIDHFVQINRKKDIGSVVLLVTINGYLYALIELYKTIDKNFHLLRIEVTEQYKVFPVKDFHRKHIYMRFGVFQTVTSEPNMLDTC